MSWAQIGTLLHVSAQAVHQKHRPSDRLI
jgi:hypothetical protein